MTSAANKAIEIAGLDYSFGTGETAKQVLFEIDLSLEPGEFAIMTGPSGSGKTTLLSLVGALRRPQGGQLNVLGHDLNTLESPGLESYRQQLGFIFQLHNLFPALTAFQSVQMAGDLHPEAADQMDDRIRALLTQLGLGERLDYRPHQLSGGQRQRVAIARALVHRPALVLADEPTAALDGENTEIVLGLLAELAHERGTTVLMVTQDARVFESADRLINLVDGQLDSDVRLSE
ncbi:MAG: ATP-binding cassette domain-containing protein [Myxococcota bacterium]|jgi:putative ABC transport system ATP-binding protein|nr:ATP-binding cassette domain-containing protein [Myxococcota bacterium]